jgi:N-ethylmaleimide reductase
MNGGAGTVSSSAVAIDGEVFTPQGMQRHVTPRELRDDELPGIVAAFRRGARNAKNAGFDGVELHGANGYLLDQFLRDGCNRRSGPYGGSIANRARLLLECVDACAAEVGAGRVGVRLSPLNGYNGMRDSDPVGLVSYVAAELSRRGIAYLHLMRADPFGVQQADVVTPARAAFRGALVLNMRFTRDEAEQAIASGTADAVAFGVPFIANPDLVERFRAGAALAAPDQATFYTPGPKGYVDYPPMQPAAAR